MGTRKEKTPFRENNLRPITGAFFVWPDDKSGLYLMTTECVKMGVDWPALKAKIEPDNDVPLYSGRFSHALFLTFY